MSVKLSGTPPKDDRNGLGAISAALLENPEARHMIVCVVDCSKITTDMDNGDVVPSARIRAVEAFPASSRRAKELHRLWQAAYEDRTGKTPLPLDDDAVKVAASELRAAGVTSIEVGRGGGDDDD